MANKKLNATLTIGGAVSGALKSSITDTTGRIKKVGDALRDLQRQQRTLGDGIQTFGRMGKNVDTLRAKYAAVTGEIEKQRRELERLQQAEAKRQANLDRRSELKGQIGDTVGMAAAVGLPVIGAAKSAGEFQYQLQLIANTANMTTAETQALGRAILSASQQTGQSAQAMQQAMGFLIAAGMDVKTAQASLIQIGKTATASGAEIEDLARAAFTLTDSLKIAPGQALQDALDTLAQAGKEGNVELKDMAKVLPVLGAGFVSLKMEGREAAATMGAALEIARKGAASADQAATNMENFIAKVMSPETLKKARENFGMDLYAIIQNAQRTGGNPFEAAMKAIMEATNGDQKKIGELFQDMQVQNFIRPMIQNWDEYNRIKNVALSAKGVTDADYAKVVETAKMQTKALADEVGRLGIAVGGPLAVAFGVFANALTPVIKGATDLATEFPTVTAAILGTATALTVGRLAMLAFGIVGTFLGPMLGTLATAFRAVGMAVMFVGRMLLLNPIGLAVTVIAGAALLLMQHWEPVKAFFVNLWADITATFDRAIGWIVGKIDAIGQKWQTVKNFIGFGDDPAPAAAGPAAARQGPWAPPPVAGARGGSSYNDSSQKTFNIYQQPGQDPKAMAKTIDDYLRQRHGVNNRSQMPDVVTP